MKKSDDDEHAMDKLMDGFDIGTVNKQQSPSLM